MVTLYVVSSVSWACGGLVCEPGPVESLVVQNAERIAFHIDEDEGLVETHVQVFYEGPPDQFGWVVPVSSAPEVFLSTEALFDVLGTQLAPTVRLDVESEGNCRDNRGRGGCLGCTESSIALSETDDGGFFEEPVDVIDQGSVGPYDFAVLSADEAAPLLAWMQDNGFAVTDDLEPLLAPYLAGDAHFLAVKLSKDADTGDIAPLGWTYEGDSATIPIQLTALAAAPDLRLEVSVFGDHRAVPESYLHVKINEANLDWFSGGDNYYDVVSRAADQAGGHAFATDYAGDASVLGEVLWNDGREASARRIAEATTASAFGDALMDMGLQPNANVVAAFSDHLPGISVETYPTVDFRGSTLADTDLGALAADLELFVFEPLRRAQMLAESPWVSRMSSSLDADEMTVDPVFVLNEDLEPVSNAYTATMVFECFGTPRGEAPRRLELTDGRVYQLPAQNDVDSDSDYWRANASEIEALLIEQPSKHGASEVIVDNSESAWAESDGGRVACGCRGARAPATGALLLAVFLGVMRRRCGFGSALRQNNYTP